MVYYNTIALASSLTQTVGNNNLFVELLLIIGALLGGTVWFASVVRDHETLTRSEAWAGFFLTALAVYFFGNIALEYSSLSIRIIWVGQAMLGHFGEALYMVFASLVKKYTGNDLKGEPNDSNS